MILDFLDKAHANAATVGEQFVIERAMEEIEHLRSLLLAALEEIEGSIESEGTTFGPDPEIADKIRDHLRAQGLFRSAE